MGWLRTRTSGLTTTSATPALLDTQFCPCLARKSVPHIPTKRHPDKDGKEESPVESSAAFLPQSRTLGSYRRSTAALSSCNGGRDQLGNYQEAELGFSP